MKTFFIELLSWKLSKQLSQLHKHIITVCHCYHWNIEGTAAFDKTINTNINTSNNKKIRFKFDENCSCESWQYDLQFNFGPWKNLWLAIIDYLYWTSFISNCKYGLLLMSGTVLMLTNCWETVMCLCVCTLNLSVDKTSQVPMYSSSFDALR